MQILGPSNLNSPSSLSAALGKKEKKKGIKVKFHQSEKYFVILCTHLLLDGLCCNKYCSRTAVTDLVWNFNQVIDT